MTSCRQSRQQEVQLGTPPPPTQERNHVKPPPSAGPKAGYSPATALSDKMFRGFPEQPHVASPRSKKLETKNGML